jgi:hypothetical protein
MAGLTEFNCRLNETSHASQFKWLDNTFNETLCLAGHKSNDKRQNLKILSS